MKKKLFDSSLWVLYVASPRVLVLYVATILLLSSLSIHFALIGVRGRNGKMEQM